MSKKPIILVMFRSVTLLDPTYKGQSSKCSLYNKDPFSPVELLAFEQFNAMSKKPMNLFMFRSVTLLDPTYKGQSSNCSLYSLDHFSPVELLGRVQCHKQEAHEPGYVQVSDLYT